ncbi:hypothetical protein SAMCFNEI73_Ch0071 [Sinorhizobium americanum]|uniref:Uncharacterized protein n=1 Tax=Sinorhizobium americanum TaxID=194963 RepID=A0A1L3LHA9_9HYPH|nr:hypothetical protein SAMCCGM7_Ch0072 [Sinorhizobium americanum CCGM7]APG89413.1 hypothetical protein SAMCFNEI73_Ch0071 [Sinorhizobium americanum]
MAAAPSRLMSVEGTASPCGVNAGARGQASRFGEAPAGRARVSA